MTEAQLKAKITRLRKKANAAYPSWSVGMPEPDYTEYTAISKEYNTAYRELMALQRETAVKKPVQFVTWKRYGFRHIAAGDHSLCGNRIWIGYREGSWVRSDRLLPEWARGTDRPLCGHCRKAWKKATGEELA